MQQRQLQYFKQIFTILKAVAFHQLYIETNREQLCQDDNFDPLTAFKSMDSFQHNRITPYQLHSFFDLHAIESTIDECQQIIKCLNKSLEELDYKSFQEMVMPHKSSLRDLSLTRFSHVQIGVGSFSRLNYVKQHSQRTIALFMQKQLNFVRKYLSMRQQFGRNWGSDIYTALQQLFKKKQCTAPSQLFTQEGQHQLTFDHFYNQARTYGFLFNQQQFTNLWRRSKKQSFSSDHLTRQTTLSFDQLSELLLVNNFKTKIQYGLQRNVPLHKAIQKPTPSYKQSAWKQQLEWQRQKKQKQLEEMQKMHKVTQYTMRYQYAYPHLMHSPGIDLRQRGKQWNKQVEGMNNQQLLSAYNKIKPSYTAFRH